MASDSDKKAKTLNLRPLAVKTITEDVIQPITANHLLLAKTTDFADEAIIDYDDIDDVDVPARQAYINTVLSHWWKKYYGEVFFNLLPFQKYKETKRHQNLQIGDIALLHYNNAFKPEYRLARVAAIYPDQQGIVRSLDVHTYPRDVRDRGKPYRYKSPDVQHVNVQRLCLLVPVEEQPGYVPPVVPDDVDQELDG